MDPQETEFVYRTQAQGFLERSYPFFCVARQGQTEAEVTVRPREARVERNSGTQARHSAVVLPQEEFGASHDRLRHLVASIERPRLARHLVGGHARLASRGAPGEARDLA